MLGRLDAVPGVAGDDPAVRRIVFQRVEVFRLAGQHADHFTALEQAACRAFADELGQIGTEQHVEDRIGFGVGQCLHHATSVELAKRRRLLGHELHIGLSCFEQLLERRHGGLAVFVVRVHHRPALFLELDGLGHQHRGLHVGAGTQAVGVAVAAAPDDLVGQRLAGQVEKLLLLGEVGQRQPGVRQERTRQHIDLFTRNQLFCGPHGVAGAAVVVAYEQLDFLAVDATTGVQLLHRQLHAFFVRLQECGLRLVAVDLTNPDRALRVRGGNAQNGGRRDCKQKQGVAWCHGSILGIDAKTIVSAPCERTV